VSNRTIAADFPTCPSASANAAAEADNEAGGRVQPTLPVGMRAGRVMLQRLVPVPPYRPKPPWWSIGPNNPSPTCTPFNLPEAAVTWRTLYSFIDAPKVLGDRCGCGIVQTAYDLFMRASVPKSARTFRLADNGNCVSEQLARSRTHRELEDDVIANWQAVEKTLAPQALPGGVRDAEIDLIEATDGGKIVPTDPSRTLTQKHVDTDITYPENVLAGGLLFGGGSADGRVTDDSEFGPDTRDLSGTIKLHRSDSGTDPALMRVEATFTFKYDIHDGLDFCPGNTIQKAGVSVDRFQYNEIITDFSRLEASGMARDVGFDVSYHRTRTRTSDIPLAPPAPTPKKTVIVPAEALFGYNKDRLRPEAAAALLTALGSKPTHQDPAKMVQVRGHTDSKGSTTYNQGLSERRADAVKELLERKYANLVGLISARGFGETRPIAPNESPDGTDDPAGRARNRRVEIEFDIQVP